MRDDVENKRARLVRHIADLKEELNEARVALAALPKRKAGRPRGLRMPNVVTDHNFSAAKEALRLLQIFENNQRKKNLSIRLPAAEKERIIAEARKKYPRAKRDRVVDLFNRNRKWDEKKWTPRGYVNRLRGLAILDT